MYYIQYISTYMVVLYHFNYDGIIRIIIMCIYEYVLYISISINIITMK